MEQRDFALTLTLRSGYEFSIDFGQPPVADLRLDEPAPLGQGHGPNAARLLAAAVGNCLSASLLLCLRKARIDVPELRTTVTSSIVRNERGWLRIGEIRVRLEPGLSPEARGRIGRCLELFQDFCDREREAGNPRAGRGGAGGGSRTKSDRNGGNATRAVGAHPHLPPASGHRPGARLRVR